MFGGEGIDSRVSAGNLLNARLDLRQALIYSSYWSRGNYFWDCNTGVNANDVYELWISHGVFRSTHSVGTALVALQQTQGDVGINYESNRFDFIVSECQFNNVRKGIAFNTPVTTQNFDVAGSGVSSGIWAEGFRIDNNYFGALVRSTDPYSTNSSNTAEYMSEAIEVQVPNPAGWYFPGTVVGYDPLIVSNKIDRAFRGILVDGVSDHFLDINTNSIFIEDDLTYANNFGYGVALMNTQGIMSVSGNTLDAIDWSPTTTNTTSAVYCYNNYGLVGIWSPMIYCNNETHFDCGFHFDGSNDMTDWRNNTMCTNFAGLALTNSAVIGYQGWGGQGNGNEWLDMSFGCNSFWFTPQSFWQTYCENSDPTQSILLLMNTAPWDAIFHGGSPNPYSPTTVAAAGSNNPGCTTSPYNAPPAWRNGATVIIEDVNDKTIELYPNPTNGEVWIRGQGKDTYLNVNVQDLTGKTVALYKELRGQEIFIDLGYLHASAYLLTISSSNGAIYHKKLLKTD